MSACGPEPTLSGDRHHAPPIAPVIAKSKKDYWRLRGAGDARGSHRALLSELTTRLRLARGALG
jgi:hypothetical protein